MAIDLFPTINVLDTRAYFHTKKTGIAVDNLVSSDLGCTCLPLNCEVPMPQFINRADQGNTRENDFHSFIFELVPSATMECTITNLSTNTSTLITNNDYGAFFNTGSFTDRPRVWALRVDWNKVFDEDGYGVYRFNFVVKNSASTEIYNEDSICFQLMPWDCDKASGTVRIETTQFNEIEGGFNYTGINYQFVDGVLAFNIPGWQQQIRWYGRFSHETPTVETDYVENNQRGWDQVQQRTFRNYNLRLDYTRVELSKPIIEDYFSANKILISDYSTGAHEIINDQRVVLEEISDFPDEAFTQDITFNSKWSEYRKDKIKRNN